MSKDNAPETSNSALASKPVALPLYHQVYLALREQILDGSIAGGSTLPSEHKLVTRFEMSRVTIRRALRLLENDRLVERRQGVGTRATPNRYTRNELFDLGKITDNAVIDGIKQYPTHSAEIVETPPKFTRMFAPHKELVRLVRIRERDGVPYSVSTFHLPVPVMKSLDTSTANDKPLLSAVIEAGYIVDKGEQTINATSASDYQAKLLNIPVGAPLLLMTATFMDKEEKVIMHTEGCFRPEYYEYKNILYRKLTKNGPRWGPNP